MFDMFQNFAKENEEAYKESPQRHSTTSDSRVFVVSVGGSVFFDNPPNTELIGRLADAVNRLSREGYKIVLVAGGGKTARNYVEAAGQIRANKFDLDRLGIAATRINAALLMNALENPCYEVLKKVEDAGKALDEGNIPVFGGLIPSFTTDAVGALIAEFLDATFINLTNVDGIYSSDPNENSDAVLLSEISYGKLIQMIAEKGSEPGQNIVLDLPCCLILQRSNLKGIVLNGNDLDNFERAIKGGQFKGTIVCDSVNPDFSVSETNEDGAEIEGQEISGKIKPARKKRKVARTSSRKTFRKPARKTSQKDFDPHDVYRIDFGRR